MNSLFTQNIVRFFLFLSIQIFICDNILLWGFLNPFIYIIFILLLPMQSKSWVLLLCGFILGFVMDVFHASGGAHIVACVFVAFIRPKVLLNCFGLNYENQHLKISNASGLELLKYILIMCFSHHLILFSLEFFDFNHINLILKQVLLSGVFSSILIFIALILFRNK